MLLFSKWASGFFLPHKNIKFDSKDVYIGGHPKGKGFANVMLTNFEIYSKIYDTPPPEKYSLPEQIIQLIEDDMGYRTG